MSGASPSPTVIIPDTPGASCHCGIKLDIVASAFSKYCSPVCEELDSLLTTRTSQHTLFVQLPPLSLPAQPKRPCISSAPVRRVTEPQKPAKRVSVSSTPPRPSLVPQRVATSTRTPSPTLSCYADDEKEDLPLVTFSDSSSRGTRGYAASESIRSWKRHVAHETRDDAPHKECDELGVFTLPATIREPTHPKRFVRPSKQPSGPRPIPYSRANRRDLLSPGPTCQREKTYQAGTGGMPMSPNSGHSNGGDPVIVPLMAPKPVRPVLRRQLTAIAERGGYERDVLERRRGTY
ncbi:hypothetical protein GLOTRDRAFT_133485 [Gloeophyllum trabeum ATCC 11539]|uniref:Uncharacterized protein n=1 Tax=Gloeophyllum trabeum (strain ATCC 11539 / FP-39264 / Madison 617) TaxID=670483 RepID=S7PUT2_GLOTA|nr:uncharacterized protein GLOTRDRAFT_133485 [Gloeophyllum trabeum ATCC 11539]EPQ51168.1 hypothetical protein GLOTRDRAFT_133485 [Gloeophyllum trabeum ATCC 11539]